MKIASNIEQYFDDEGRPLVNGRVTFFDHDSDTLSEIFYLVGNDYTAAPNPLITADDGRVPTVFFEASVKDVRVEKQLPDGTYALLDTFEVGFDYPTAKNSTFVYGIQELKNADPEVGIVTVSGYYSDYDAPLRSYVWDPNCSLDADGGIIIESDVGYEGRWILLWDDELLPSSIYGIVAGSNEANIAGFISYPDRIGTYQVRTAPIPRFLGGNYTTAGALSTTKTLYFDKGARFASAYIDCASAIVPENNTYVADMYFTANNAEAHSSWFKTVDAFWRCNAHKLVIDGTNYFTDFQLKNVVTIANTIIEGDNRIATTYAAGKYIMLQSCSILGEGIFSPSQDYLIFRSMTFDERWFNTHNVAQFDFGMVSGGHHVEFYTSMTGNQIVYAGFINPNIYLKACYVNGDAEFDGHGASYTSVLGTNSVFTTMRNMTYSGQITDSVCTTWDNVNVDYIQFSGVGRVATMHGCTFTLTGDTSAMAGMTFTDCTVVGGKFCPSYTALTIKGGTWCGAIELSDTAKTNRTRNKAVVIEDAFVNTRANNIWVNDITMRRCTSNAHVYLVPYLDSDDSLFHSRCVVEDNRFCDGALWEINVKNPASEWSVFDVRGDFTFVRNKFDQDDGRGIVLPYWTQDYANVYLYVTTKWLYKGNLGSCPGEMTKQAWVSASEMTRTYLGWHYLPESREERCLVPSVTATITWGIGIAFEKRSDIWRPYNLTDARTYVDYAIRIAATEQYNDAKNDFFLVTHAWEDLHEYDADYSMFIFQPA